MEGGSCDVMPTLSPWQCLSTRPQVLLRQALLATYFKHVMQYKETLLTKFFGLHRVKPHGGRNVRFVVMGNLFCTTAKIDRRFDLKGSTYGRLTPPGYNPETKILKDLDLDYQLQLEEGGYEKLIHQIKVDCQLLEKCNIMDYSLLLGISFRSRASTNELAALAAGPAGAGAATGAGARKKPGGAGAKAVGFDPAAGAEQPEDPEMQRLAKEASERLPKPNSPQRRLDRTLSSVLKGKAGAAGGRLQVAAGDAADPRAADDDDDDEDFAPEQSARPALGARCPAFSAEPIGRAPCFSFSLTRAFCSPASARGEHGRDGGARAVAAGPQGGGAGPAAQGGSPRAAQLRHHRHPAGVQHQQAGGAQLEEHRAGAGEHLRGQPRGVFPEVPGAFGGTENVRVFPGRRNAARSALMIHFSPSASILRSAGVHVARLQGPARRVSRLRAQPAGGWGGDEAALTPARVDGDVDPPLLHRRRHHLSRRRCPEAAAVLG